MTAQPRSCSRAGRRSTQAQRRRQTHPRAFRALLSPSAPLDCFSYCCSSSSALTCPLRPAGIIADVRRPAARLRRSGRRRRRRIDLLLIRRPHRHGRPRAAGVVLPPLRKLRRVLPDLLGGDLLRSRPGKPPTRTPPTRTPPTRTHHTHAPTAHTSSPPAARQRGPSYTSRPHSPGPSTRSLCSFEGAGAHTHPPGCLTRAGEVRRRVDHLRGHLTPQVV